MQVPSGPLELHVYPGENCRGELYFDDGVHITGPSLRQSLSCTATPNGVQLHFGARQGTWRPWWKSIAVTVHGAQGMSKMISDHPRAGDVVIAAR